MEMLQPVEVLKGQPDAGAFRRLHQLSDAAQAAVRNCRGFPEAGGVYHHCGKGEGGAVIYAGKQLLQVSLSLRSLLPQCIGVLKGRVDVIDGQPQLSGQGGLAALVLLAPP